MFFKVIQRGYETFRNVEPAPQNDIAKTLNLELKLSRICTKAPNRHSVICSEINSASITNCKMKGVAISSCLL